MLKKLLVICLLFSFCGCLMLVNYWVVEHLSKSMLVNMEEDKMILLTILDIFIMTIIITIVFSIFFKFWDKGNKYENQKDKDNF